MSSFHDQALPVADIYLRMPDVRRITGLSKPTIYRRISAGEFPRGDSLGGNCVGWRASKINAWLAERGGNSSDD